jgi:hypothetical protein
MSIKELEDLLEATRQKIADQGRIVDARLLEKERMLEQAVIDAHLDADDNPYVFHPRSTRTAFVTPRLLEKERMLEQAVIDAHLDAEDDTQKHTYARPNRRYMTAGMYLPSATSPELSLALNHITNVTLQDLLAEYKD